MMVVTNGKSDDVGEDDDDIDGNAWGSHGKDDNDDETITKLSQCWH